MDSPKDALARIKRGFEGPLVDRDSRRKRAPSCGFALYEAIFRPVPSYGFKDAGIEGDYRVLRRTHEQILMDRLEAHDYKEGSVIEISAKRLRHSMQTAVRHYADLRTNRGQKAAEEAWETPIVKVRDRGA